MSRSPRIPYAPESPWPSMRADGRNTGIFPLSTCERAPVMEVRRWPTGNGIFSTPVVGADETIYVGSGDRIFYALDPVSGEQRWTFPTGECIDSAGCIARDGTIWFVSCDGGLYGLTPEGEERWRLNLFEAREHFTPSTMYWWEANVVLGPNGWLYAGNDDFCFYAIEPFEGVRWSCLTGLHIWGAPAFGDDGAVYFVSFDLHAYALDAETGEERWRTRVGNFVASTPAVLPDGTVVFGMFDGRVVALEPREGGIRWEAHTRGPIYASPAVAEDGTIYVGSSDGNLYALTPEGRQRWTFYTGDAIRGSASLGPDPEGKSPYLVYFGGGNGVIYALDPEGRRRWSLDTRVHAEVRNSPNINASMALGRAGLTTATANGDVFYVPYHYYLEHPGAPGIELEPGDGFPQEGGFLHYVSPSGNISQDPLVPDAEDLGEPEHVGPAQALSFRLLARREGQTLPAKLEPDSIEVEARPERPFEVLFHPDQTCFDLIPRGFLPADTATRLAIRARYGDDRGEGAIRGALAVQPRTGTGAPAIEDLPDHPFHLTHMYFCDPTMVTTFDQIAIAGLVIQCRVVHVDPESGRVVAWGVLKFGIEEEGEVVQVAIPRHLYYALEGRYDQGRMVLTARDCDFEITAFSLPLDRLRFSGAWQDREGPHLGASVYAELDVNARVRFWERLGLDDVREAVARALRPGGGPSWSRVTEFVKDWFPSSQRLRSSLPLLGRSVARTIPMAWRVLDRDVWRPWGLVGDDGWFRGSGTFRTQAAPRSETGTSAPVEVRRFDYDARNRRVIAELTATAPNPPASAVPGILLVDLDAVAPVILRYNRHTRVERRLDEGCWEVTLSIPRKVSLRGRRVRALLLFDLETEAELDLEDPAEDR